MLQPNPCRRIRIADIKLHPWLRKEVPVYARLSFCSGAYSEPQFALDLDVLAQVRALDMGSLRGVTDIERIGKIIRKRMDDSFVTAYELIKDEKERHEHYQQQCLNPNFEPRLQIFSNLPNKLRRTAIDDEQRDYLFGKSFTVGARRLMEATFAVFQQMEIEFAIKSTPPPMQTTSTACSASTTRPGESCR
jgi:hypothetical protein